MNTRLEEAFAKASQLPPDEQEALAALLLDEIASERLWDQAFAQSQDQIAKLADEALTEFQEGRTVLLDEEHIVISHITDKFRKAFHNLPAPVQRKARKAFHLWRKTPAIPCYIISRYTGSNRSIPSVSGSAGEQWASKPKII